MSHDHHEHSLDQMLAIQVSNQISAHLNSPIHSDKIKFEIFDELGRAILQLSSMHNTAIDASKFIATPRKLSNGSCVALINTAMPYISNAWTLVVAGDIASRENRYLVIYRENPKQLNSSIYHQTNAEQTSEIFRQLNLLSKKVPEFKTPAVFTVVFIENEIDGYPYDEDDLTDTEPQDNAELLPEGRGESTTVVASTKDQLLKQYPAPVKRGPTLAQLSTSFASNVAASS